MLSFIFVLQKPAFLCSVNFEKRQSETDETGLELA